MFIIYRYRGPRKETQYDGADNVSGLGQARDGLRHAVRHVVSRSHQRDIRGHVAAGGSKGRRMEEEGKQHIHSINGYSN